MSKTAMLTGVSGQDGSYLSEFLLEKNYNVVGVARRSTRTNSNCDNFINDHMYTHEIMDITDPSGMRNLIAKHSPDEFYNLAAQSHVGVSFNEPLTTLMIDGYAVAGILEGIRHESPKCHFYQASSSELFGNNCREAVKTSTDDVIFDGAHYIQDENTPFSPRSPYGASKAYAHDMTRIYREAYDIHASCGILFNHCSPRRGLDFVTRKITDGVARIHLGLEKNIKMGNLNAWRDIGNSKDYVEAMWMMLQQDSPDDYIIGMGEAVSIKSILIYVCSLVDIFWEDIYEQDPRFMRPAEVNYLCSDSSKARKKLGWEPKYTWKTTLEEMFEHDLRRLRDAEVEDYKKSLSSSV